MLHHFKAAAAVGLTLALCASALAQDAEGPPPDKGAGVKVSKAVSHENLSIFFLAGEESYQGPELLTLEEALAQKKVVLHETGKVSELAIENVSDSPVFIQAGDIVKGGKQDRTLRNDQILPPKSGKRPLASFCVESGRWRQRKGESVDEFSGSSKALNSKELKLAARLRGDQSAVWREVAKAQQKLSGAIKGQAADARSATSLQLTLENKALAAKIKAYRAALAGAIAAHPEAIGFAFAVNGRVVSADMYASRGLFKKLWPKLIDACIAEAIGEGAPQGKPAEAANAEAVEACLARAAAAPAKKQAGTASAQESRDGYFFISKTGAKKKRWLRKSFVAR